ncbi:salicylate synthase [Nocardia stercoris]|uniref:salicylate synthase n=1 Tax=Nocardia stercoris TaxID=2483361 RepID=UPI0018F3B4AE|nr:salicylate synthase [Nocardia stercoris]
MTRELGPATEFDRTVPTPRADPIEVVTSVVRSGLLSDYLVYERSQRWYLASNPLGEVTVGRDWIRSTLGGEHAENWVGSPWPRVHAALRRTPADSWRAYGWACFELCRPDRAAPSEVLAHIMVPTVELEIADGSTRIRSTSPALGADLARVITNIGAGEPNPESSPVRSDELDRHYLGLVESAVGRIRSGLLQKVIVSRTVDIPFEVDMPATYAAGRRANTPARSFLLDLGGWQAAGFSPETVLEADASGSVATQPLAGTRARTGDHATDHALRTELLTDTKEIYEHATSVKLAFDELNTVGQAGTTRVSEFLTIKDRGSVQHLGSRVETSLTQARTSWDALAAVFPAVTASGIPKTVACETIGALESEPRGLYSGAVLMADSTGALDAALVLRAVYQHEGRAWLRAGAGVVAASDPTREHEETCEKLTSVAPYVVPAVGAWSTFDRKDGHRR